MTNSGLRHVVVAGASGLIGRALVESLRAENVRVTTLVRTPDAGEDEHPWLIDDRPLDPEVIAGADAVVGLNGASIGRLPWTRRYRHTLLWSRITPTRALARAVRALGDAAPHFVSASAVGFYGATPIGPVTEASARGDGFLADVCGEWEAAAQSAGDAARVSLLRTAPVIHREGVLSPLIRLTALGLGGPLGSGTQEWPWISLADEVRAVRHVIDHGISGPVNLTGPARATANDIGFAVARELNRPFLVRAPAWGLELALGQDAARALLTTDARVIPDVLTHSGFTWRHTTAEAAVHEALAA